MPDDYTYIHISIIIYNVLHGLTRHAWSINYLLVRLYTFNKGKANVREQKKYQIIRTIKKKKIIDSRCVVTSRLCYCETDYILFVFLFIYRHTAQYNIYILLQVLISLYISILPMFNKIYINYCTNQICRKLSVI